MKWPWTKSDRPNNATLATDKPRKRKRRRSRLRLGLGQLLFVLGFTVATTAAGVYTVYSQYQVVKLGYALDQQLFDYRRELEASKRLNLSISSYKHPSAVSAFADEALDMRQPSNADELIVPAPTPSDDDLDDKFAVDPTIPTTKVDGAADPVVQPIKADEPAAEEPGAATPASADAPTDGASEAPAESEDKSQ